MKKILSLIFLFILSFSLVSILTKNNSEIVYATESNSEETYFIESDRDIDVGYLLRENFSPYESAGSGWTKYNIPAHSGLGDVKKSNTSLETYIKKYFVSQSGEITIEISFGLAQNIQSGYIVILGNKNNKEVEAIKIKIEEDVLKYVDYSGNKTTLTTLSYDYKTGLKIVASASSNKAQVYVDGLKINETSNLSFNEPCDTLEGIQIGIDKSSSGGLTMKYVTVRKGFDLFEDLSTVGMVETFEPGYDFNKAGISTNVTVNDHSIQNDNNALAPLCYDDDDNTYWEHNVQYSITQNVYFMMQYGKTVLIDYLYIKFKSYYKGVVNITCKTPSGTWVNFANSYTQYETTEGNGYIIEFRSSSPVAMEELAIGFMIGSGDYKISSGVIQVSTVIARCDNPNEVTINTFPSDFIKEASENTSLVNASLSSDNIFSLVDNNSNDNLKTYANIDRKGDITTEFKVNFKDNKDGNRIGLVNSDNSFIGFETKNNKLCFVEIVNENKKYTEIVNSDQNLNNLVTNIWHRLSFSYDESNNSVIVDYNGWNPIDSIKLSDSFKNSIWKKFYIESSKDITSFDFDNIKVYKTLEESDVPEIDACNTGDTILTMQVCSLWREGTHTGWQTVDYENGYERKSILGWYDEGTAEVADWEIKIARDHGISNFMYCWYRKGNGLIKDSNYSDAIWDGLFKSKYKNDINFTIMFENSSSSVYSYDDLMDNLMPYWIEVFFKNPNYQKTADGEPILYVYAGDMLKTVGDINGDGSKDKLDMQYVTNKMREMVIEAGFPGLYISAEARTKSSSSIKLLEDYGYDSVFAYCWTSGQYNVSDDETLAFSMDMLETQRAAIQDTSKFNILPNLSRCWDPSAWMDSGFNPMGATYTYDLEHYREFALWIKNVFKGTEIDSKGTKMVMLDNWNEYSEGHWMLPTYGLPSYKDGTYAYGYLDILREVFGINEYEHKDYLPLEEGFGPYDTWYPFGWDKPINQCGIIEDNSIFEESIIDHVIGYNTLAGETIYVKSVLANDSIVIDAKKANRIVIESEVLKSIITENKKLVINMLNGSIEIEATEFNKLDENKSLEIVLNYLNDISDIAIKLRKESKYILKGFCLDYSIKQNNYDVKINSLVKINNIHNEASSISLYNGVKFETKDLSSELLMKENAYIILIK